MHPVSRGNRILGSALAFALLAAAGLTASAHAQPDQRPNIVLILADDLDNTATPVWEAMPLTAALIRDRGMEFENGFAPMPICCAARASILTGKYGHNTGVLTNGGEVGGFDAFRDNGNEQATIATYLHDAGYRTGMAGKYLNGLEHDRGHIPPGWDDWNAGVDNLLYTGYGYTLNENGRQVRYGVRPQDYQTDVIARKSAEFITDSARDGRPFFWYAASTAPHFPLPAAPRHLPLTTPTAAPRSPNYQEPDVSDKPSWLIDTAQARSATIALTNDVDYTNRLGSLHALDEMVAGIVDTLDRTGELDNTYLVFTSDNGYNLGAHRLTQKMSPYEESMRVPLAIAGPGIGRGSSPATALSIDFAPTFLDWAGVPVPTNMDGRSLTGPLAGDDSGWRSDFVAEYAGGGALGLDGVALEQVPGLDSAMYAFDIPSYTALRTDRYLYVRWYERERPLSEREYELYDLRADPYQLTNLVKTEQGKQVHAETVAGLNQRLIALGACSGATCQ
ncbi:sulfatase-like hydrolase/transferase [Antrihabitans sp. YC2-6]|uniref:sulfatase-like hydrolase/transferase n=1 Tax=Antrihabitans sp. YC2-6 TaxID=2799498 RepID=UPI0018F6D731|nr:sulfatase-like hydrolase/transferase [Antrihabitans sp. YC2-6]MBJ8344747.1 sulfatase-like hydrolase/transferase [Antrihabitans sp. YC2-6]